MFRASFLRRFTIYDALGDVDKVFAREILSLFSCFFLSSNFTLWFRSCEENDPEIRRRQCSVPSKVKEGEKRKDSRYKSISLCFFSLSLSLQSTVASSSSKEEQTHVVDDEPKIGKRSDGIIRRAERDLDHNERQQHQQLAQGETPVVHSSSSAQQQEEAERRLSVTRIFQCLISRLIRI